MMDEVSSTKALLLMVGLRGQRPATAVTTGRQRILKKELKPACHLEEQADRAEAIGISLTHIILSGGVLGSTWYRENRIHG